MSGSLVSAPETHRRRAMLLHEACRRADALTKAGCTKADALDQVSREFTPRAKADGVKVGLSPKRLRSHLKAWHRGGCTAAAMLPNYGNTSRGKVPRELIDEFQRRMTMPGQKNVSVVVKSLVEQWRMGHEVPGLGTWREWYKATHPDQPMPTVPPKFPFSERTLYNHKPAPGVLALGQMGEAEFRKQSMTIERTREKLRPGELYFMDDKRPDLLVIDDQTGRVTGLSLYLMMEGSSNRIVGYSLRAGDANIKQDVGPLIARVLEREGFGLDYSTTILMEHGTLTLNDHEARLLEQVSGGKVKILKPQMLGGKRTAMSAADKSSGHWMSKVVESFMAKLDLYFQQLPGQRGKSYRDQPANLMHSVRGKMVEDADGKKFRTTVVKGGEAGKAEKLARMDAAVDGKLGLETGLLTVSQFRAVMAHVVERHNNDSEHNYEGFGLVRQAETQPGVWEDVPA